MDTPEAKGHDLKGQDVDAQDSDSLKQVAYPPTSPPGKPYEVIQHSQAEARRVQLLIID